MIPKRKKRIKPEEVHIDAEANALADLAALSDTDAQRRMFTNPIYGDPTWHEEGSPDLPTRLAQRGLLPPPRLSISH